MCFFFLILIVFSCGSTGSYNNISANEQSDTTIPNLNFEGLNDKTIFWGYITSDELRFGKETNGSSYYYKGTYSRGLFGKDGKIKIQLKEIQTGMLYNTSIRATGSGMKCFVVPVPKGEYYMYLTYPLYKTPFEVKLILESDGEGDVKYLGDLQIISFEYNKEVWLTWFDNRVERNAQFTTKYPTYIKEINFVDFNGIAWFGMISADNFRRICIAKIER
jgi:hypothetical protein